MSHAQHANPAEAHAKSNPMSVAIWVVIGAVALIVGIVLLARFAIVSYGGRSLENDPAMAPATLAKRIGPVARLQVEGAPAVAAPASAPGAKAAAVAPGAKAAAPAAPAPKVATVAPVPAAGARPDGKKVYDTACMACHATGAANAPKFGDKAAWAPRLKTGNDALYASALKGKGAMPPKGGNAALADADVKAAVDYLVAGAK